MRVQRVGFGQNRFQQYDGPTQKSHHMHHIQFQTNFPNAQFTDISTLDILQRLPLLLHKLDIIYQKIPSEIRPAQLAELPRSEFDPELFPVKFSSDIRDKSILFYILRQNLTNFDIGNGQRGSKLRENEEM